MTVLIKLTGQSLVDFHTEKMELVKLGQFTIKEIVLESGYVYDNGKPMFTEFYTELLRSKGQLPVTDTDVNDTSYDDLDSDTKELYDHVDNLFGEKWDHEDVMNFIDELSDYDVLTKDSFDDYFYGRFDTEKEFGQQFYEDIGVIDQDNPLYYHIDWDSVVRELQYDFDFIYFDYEYFVFRKG